eukprot:CAMPEP_0184514186 /NCGR_PEP_ID=MMETSP0198_2-20121128/3830_1 /TAXON_ID=1112570 /ORGANISM="Thraustochytrium sp., Strain LLF1b" /LENGTH=447 /DNA_ID=CAMNT_0026904361 /DNA_START=182 /DNA_END=1525 /DNA_ORIENTATION=+
MGGEQSVEERTTAGTIEDVDDLTYGYRVIGVQANSPACLEGLVPYFDFIVEANGQPLQAEDGLFVKIITQFENRPLRLTIYNFKCQERRYVNFVPRRGWGGAGLLGLTIKFDSFENAEDTVVHVLDVEKNSPAEKAGLIPYSDYILGTPHHSFEDLEGLFELISELGAENDQYGDDRGIDMFIYNIETDIVRRLVLVPSGKWGGEGMLGCGVGFGYLHRLPKAVQSTVGKSRSEDLIPLQTAQKKTSVDPQTAPTESLTPNENTGIEGNAHDGEGLTHDTPTPAVDIVPTKTKTASIEADLDAKSPTEHDTEPESGHNPQALECTTEQAPEHAPEQVPEPETLEKDAQEGSGREIHESEEDEGVALDLAQPVFQEEDHPECTSPTPGPVVTDYGNGMFCGNKAGNAVIVLDWELPNSATAIAFVRPEKYKAVPKETEESSPTLDALR